MLRTFRRALLLLIFLFVAAQAHLSQAQPMKPAVPDRQPREVLNQQLSIPHLPDALPADPAPDKPTVAPSSQRSRLSPDVVILNEGFEGAWPAGLWSVGDFSDSDGGEFLWDDDNCAPRTGVWDAYSVGGGAAGNQLPCWGGYPNNVYTWAIYGPFNLAGATAATMTYHFKGSSEGGDGCPFDRLFIGRSGNGTDFTGPSFCGPWASGPAGNNYYARTLDLASLLGDDSAWVGFAMISDNSVTDTGFVIDDVTIDVTASCATPVAPTLSAPANGASLTDTTPTFTWSAVANANEYDIEVDNNADFSSPVIAQTRTATSFTPGAALAAGTYHWRVGANNTAGGCSQLGPWSAIRTFTITSAPACYLLTLEKSGQGIVPTASPAASAGCANGRYTAGQTINLTASPANGWRVGSWQGTTSNGSTANSNTATMPTAPHTVRVNYVQQTSGTRTVAMPFILFGPTNFLGPREIEPNNTLGEANGPILLNRTYQGFPNDLSDYYYFDLNTTRQLDITLTGITGQDPQLHLYRDSSANRVGYDPNAPYSISYNAPPGRYWVRVVVVGNYNSSSLYTLRVNNP
jgi:hypothetical protein